MHASALATILVAASEGEPTGGGLTTFLPLLLIVAVFYLLLIRPQQRKAKQHQALVRSIGTGDRVVTIGGIHGTVESIDDDTIRIEIAPGTVITMTRAAIARRLVDADESVTDDLPPGTDTGSTDSF
ncbi:MAG: preprotein translocase subunit YajC [Nitriliruptorales bacterium]|nr:preprotein translocase subunit YajC [Nitriliruptorales bacterium]